MTDTTTTSKLTVVAGYKEVARINSNGEIVWAEELTVDELKTALEHAMRALERFLTL